MSTANPFQLRRIHVESTSRTLLGDVTNHHTAKCTPITGCSNNGSESGWMIHRSIRCITNFYSVNLHKNNNLLALLLSIPFNLTISQNLRRSCSNVGRYTNLIDCLEAWVDLVFTGIEPGSSWSALIEIRRPLPFDHANMFITVWRTCQLVYLYFSNDSLATFYLAVKAIVINNGKSYCLLAANAYIRRWHWWWSVRMVWSEDEATWQDICVIKLSTVAPRDGE